MRIGEAAERLGFSSPDMLASELRVGRCQVRTARLGARGMLHVASADLEALGALLAAGAL